MLTIKLRTVNTAPSQCVIPLSVVRGTRGYIERVANQINGTYENGWYDACAVMIRRVLERVNPILS